MPKAPRRKSKPIASGPVDTEGRLHGRASQQFPSGDTFQGRHCHGEKQGRGMWVFADGSTLSGTFQGDALQGQGVYQWPDGSELVAQYSQGQLSGLATKLDCDGDVESSGCYVEGVRHGRWYEVVDEYGAFLLGEVSADDGQWSGDKVAYVYPDKRNALVGKFEDGVLLEAVRGMCTGDSVHSYEVQKCEDNAKLDVCISTGTVICRTPLRPDPYEAHTVFVAESRVANAGEGLFAKRSLCAGELAAFYNGVRLSHSVVDSRSWSQNGNCISLDSEMVIDVPEAFSDTSVYCATLGHKANHSFTPNSRYSPCYHPLYGNIKCVQAIEDISCGDEVTVHYDYHHQSDVGLDESAPDWYLKSQPG